MVAQDGIEIPEQLREVKRAIVVAAHPDDLETMIGGTLWLLSQQGAEFYELILTRGDLGTQDASISPDNLAAMRLQEAREAAKIIGIREVEMLTYHDGELEPSLDLRAEVALYYRKWQVDSIFTFDPNWAGQIHPDHRAAGRVAFDAFMPSKMPLYKQDQLREYPVANVQRAFLFSTGEPAFYVDVTPYYDKKVAASLAHRSQFPQGEKSLEWMRMLDSEAAKRAGAEGRLYEAFGEVRLW